MGLVRSVLLCLVLVLALCLVVEGRLGCMNGYRCMSNEAAPVTQNRGQKMNSGKLKEMLKGLTALDQRNGGDLVNWDLRWVPSGPDPLHHNASPRKPRTP